MPRKTNPFVDDVASASDEGSTDEASRDETDDEGSFIDDQSQNGSELSARASAEEAMRKRDNTRVSGMKRLSLLLSKDRGSGPSRQSSKRTRSRSPSTVSMSGITKASSESTPQTRAAGKVLT